MKVLLFESAVHSEPPVENKIRLDNLAEKPIYFYGINLY